MVSFDVEGIFTNVPVNEAIEYTSHLMYSDDAKFQLPVYKDIFLSLMKFVYVDVVFSTNRFYFKQIDGVAMGSPLEPLLANVILSKFDHELSLFAHSTTGTLMKFYERC